MATVEGSREKDGKGGEEEPRTLLENEDNLGGPRFFPPLYKQRYSSVARILETRGIKKVVDFGCSECGFMRFLREVPGLEDVIGVDIDRQTLLDHQRAIQPHASDFLSLRARPMKMALYNGSLTEYDRRLASADAVTMIEVIEHLYEDSLAAFPEVLFGQIHPQYAILTTPNEEFNVLFPGFEGFRHPDHKFEWTRKEFENWCDTVAQQYGYTVTYSGVGDPPDSARHLGCCSQVAIFTRIGDKATQFDCEDEPYELIASEIFPASRQTSVSTEEDIRIQAEYYLRQTALHLRHEYWNTPSDDEQEGEGEEDCRKDEGDEEEERKECYGDENEDGDASRCTAISHLDHNDSSSSNSNAIDCEKDTTLLSTKCHIAGAYQEANLCSTTPSYTGCVSNCSKVSSCCSTFDGSFSTELATDCSDARTPSGNCQQCIQPGKCNYSENPSESCTDSLPLSSSSHCLGACDEGSNLTKVDSTEVEKDLKALSLSNGPVVNDGVVCHDEKDVSGEAAHGFAANDGVPYPKVRGYFLEDDCDTYQVCMHLEHLRGFSRLKCLCESLEQLRSILQEAGYTVTDEDYVLYDLEHNSSVESDMIDERYLDKEGSDGESHDLDSNSDRYDSENRVGNYFGDVEASECWDDADDDAWGNDRTEASEDKITVVTDGGYTYTRQLQRPTCCHGNLGCPISDCNHGDHFCLDTIRCDHDMWSPTEPALPGFVFGYRRKAGCTCVSSQTAAPTMANDSIRTLCPACTPAFMLGKPLHEPHQFSDSEDS